MLIRLFISVYLFFLIPFISCSQSYHNFLNKGIRAFNESKDSIAIAYFLKAERKLTELNMRESYESAQVNYYLAQFHIASKKDQKAIDKLEESKSIIVRLGNKDHNLLFSEIINWLEMLYSTNYDSDKF